MNTHADNRRSQSTSRNNNYRYRQNQILNVPNKTEYEIVNLNVSSNIESETNKLVVDEKNEDLDCINMESEINKLVLDEKNEALDCDENKKLVFNALWAKLN